MDVFNAFKGIEDDIKAAVEGTMPRQAVVTSPADDGGVWVRFTPVDTNKPESWFPSTIAGLSAGTVGWVYPLAGGKGLFVAAAITVPIPLVGSAAWTPQSTTSISAYHYLGAGSVTVPPGTYRASGVASVPLSRSVSTGEMWAVVRIAGVESTPYGVAMGWAQVGANQFFALNAVFDIDITTEDGTVPLEIGIRGANTAGTTTTYRAAVNGTLTRII